MVRFFFIGFLALQLSGLAHGSEPCDPHSLLSVLDLNSDLKIKEGEKSVYGHILKKGEKVGDLKDGTHIYLIDADHHVMIEPRFPDLDEAHPIVTHRSLLNRLRETLKKEPKLVALGEIDIDHGLVSSINNHAGTAFMSEEELPAAAKVLKNSGLKVTSETQLLSFKMVKNGHDPEHIAAAFRIEVLKDPKLSALQNRLLDFRKKVFARFPSKKEYGKVDWVSFLQSKIGPADHLNVTDKNELNQSVLTFLGWIENPNDRYRVLPTLRMKQYSIEELETLFTNLERFEGFFNY
jgi:hypothetical protein